ncbi:Glucose dehydrogenase [acceptor] [Papilio machaon]|uniref:Glucose dehydrogenase [acceptor] n=1 Tax=Papilio machaon TaxID=76193 RepID=A0A194R0E8_PAPMA|nr:Glucose dehydrogenase [acceptor] [Papilio machaon]
MTWSCNPELASRVTQDYVASGPLLFNAIQGFLAAQCLLAPIMFPEPTISDIKKIANTTFDFIIVGAGTAGAVVANRLSEANWSILLLEAGGNPTLGTEIPALYVNNYETKVDWNFRTEPQKYACLNYKDQKCYWPRGKVLGGTSSINGMFYLRGNKQDYDDWSSTTSTDWNYESVLEYFNKSENVVLLNDTMDFDMKYHGLNGYLNAQYNGKIHPLEQVIIDANKELGSLFVKDFNGNTQMGVGIAFTTLKDGKRQSTINTFLKPIKNQHNLHVLPNVYVDKIIFDNNTAKGVHIRTKYGYSKVFATKEIILSAGTINSPVILLNSGMKRRHYDNNDFKREEIILPIGENLQDHIYAPIFYKMKSSDDANTLENIFKAYYQYITEQKGPLSDLSPHRVISFINTTDSNSKTPDIQNHFFVAYPNQSNLVDLFGKHALSSQFLNMFAALNKDHLIITIFVTLLRPKSNGVIETNDIDSSVKIKANYLEDQDDLETLIRGMKHAIKLEKTEAFKKADLTLHWFEIDACAPYDKKSDQFLECIARHLTGTLYHAVGTNKMGSMDDSSSVVDETLKVRFVNKLRVIDASIMPNIVKGNPMAAVIMIAEKGADFIKKDWMK